MIRRRSVAPILLLPAAGFLVWAAAFVALYGALSVGCRLGLKNVDLYAGLSVQRLMLVLLTAVFLVVHAALVLRLRTRNRRDGSDPALFLRHTAFVGSVAALAASAFTFMGVLGLTSC